eukprot:4268000-Prymnesium_polylepis.1
MWRVPDRMHSGDRHPARASARCHLYRSPACMATPPIIHAVVIRSIDKHAPLFVSSTPRTRP